MKLSEIVGETVRILGSHGYNVELISYPEDHRRRGIDIAASRQDHSVLIKVVEDTSDLSPRDIKELRSSSHLLGVDSIVVAERNKGVDIDNIVAIEKSGVYMVSVEGLRAALRNEIYVVHRQGNLYMRVNGEKLRSERIKRGYSLGDIASLLGVTRRSVYLYEQGRVEVSLSTALKLLDLFGDEIFEPIPVLGEGSQQHYNVRQQTRQLHVQGEETVTEKALEGIARVGGEAVEVKRIPPDIVARLDRERMLIVVEKRRDRKFEKRVRETVKVAHHVKARVMALVQSPDKRVIAEEYSDVEVYRDVEEMVEDIRRLSGRT